MFGIINPIQFKYLASLKPELSKSPGQSKIKQFLCSKMFFHNLSINWLSHREKDLCIVAKKRKTIPQRCRTVFELRINHHSVMLSPSIFINLIPSSTQCLIQMHHSIHLLGFGFNQFHFGLQCVSLSEQHLHIIRPS